MSVECRAPEIGAGADSASFDGAPSRPGRPADTSRIIAAAATKSQRTAAVRRARDARCGAGASDASMAAAASPSGASWRSGKPAVSSNAAASAAIGREKR
jgi:hypothetical protein